MYNMKDRLSTSSHKSQSRKSEERGTVIELVSDLYKDFKEKFGSTSCKTLSNVDFSDGDQLGEYIVEKKWKSTCDFFLDFTIRKLHSMGENGKL